MSTHNICFHGEVKKKKGEHILFEKEPYFKLSSATCRNSITNMQLDCFTFHML